MRRLVTVAAATIVAAVFAVPASSRSEVDRIAASTPVEAGVAVSRTVFADAATRHAVLVRDDVFADALAAAPLAGELPDLAPILFTPGDRLAGAVAAELRRVTGGDGTVHLVGGPAALSPAVEDDVRALGLAVQRVGGADRLETAELVFRTYFAADAAGDDVVVSRADDWVDAVTAGAFGARRGVAVVLVDRRDGPTPSLRAALREAGVATALVVGGEEAVPKRVADALGVPVRRAAGASRFTTATVVATHLLGVAAPTAADPVIVVNGVEHFAYGLGAASLAAHGAPGGDAPLLVVTRDAPVSCDEDAERAAAACYLATSDTEPGRVVVVGDTSLVSDAVATALATERNG